MIKSNIFVFPCGSEIGLEIYNSLSMQKGITLIGGSSSKDNGRFVYKNYIGDIPYITDNNFISAIKKIIIDYNIDFIYPTMDVVIQKFKSNEQELNCKILCSSLETINIISNKETTYNYFKNIIKTPKIYKKNETIIFPVFSKPSVGSSSRNTILINNKESYDYAKNIYPKNLIVEFLPGEEYTVDCFSNNSILKFVSARKRTKIINGISIETELVKDNLIDEIALKINDKLKFSGPWFFQLKKDSNNNYCLLEIADRFAGSSIINRLLGINFAYLNIMKEFSDVEIFTNNFNIEIGRCLDTKTKFNIEYDTVYIDFDDTIILNDKVNTEALAFLYKAINDGCKIILVTKHKENIYESLKKYKIEVSIFTKILQLNSDENKIDFIETKNCIFIDDSFFERKQIYNKYNIPVFSIENIKYL